jgi:hypothetical protein
VSLQWRSGGYSLAWPHTGQSSSDLLKRSSLRSRDTAACCSSCRGSRCRSVLPLMPILGAHNAIHPSGSHYVQRPSYTKGSRTGSLRFFGYTLRAFFQTCGRSRGILALAIVDALVLGFVHHGALQPAYTAFNVSTQSPLRRCHRMPCWPYGCAERDFRRCADALATA